MTAVRDGGQARGGQGVRGKGITYDTGFFRAGSTTSTREVFDPQVVGRELDVIRRDLHCNAVRVTGGDPDRLELAARAGAEVGLEVWWSPFTCDLTTDELLDLLGDCAERAERLRRQGAEVVLLTGSELSLFTVGFLPGDRLEDRLGLLGAPGRLRGLLAAVPDRVNGFLAKAAEVARTRFGGRAQLRLAAVRGRRLGTLRRRLDRCRLPVDRGRRPLP
jgi:hypothetical protein